jgi:hypothetical protein
MRCAEGINTRAVWLPDRRRPNAGGWNLMTDREAIASLEDSLSSMRRQLMSVAFEDRSMREALWFVMTEMSVIVRQLRAGEPMSADVLRRMSVVLRITDALNLVVHSVALVQQSQQAACRPPWHRL